MKRCPFCAEEIQDEAIKCRYCMERLEADAAPSDTIGPLPPIPSTHDDAQTRIEIDDRPTSVFSIILFVVVVAAIAISLMVIGANISGFSQHSTASVAQMSALDQMEIAFDGNWAKAEIQKRIDQAMILYGTPKTEENYSRAGSCLVALRKNSGFQEMQILDYMIRSNVPGVNLKFAEAAGLAASLLQAGDR